MNDPRGIRGVNALRIMKINKPVCFSNKRMLEVCDDTNEPVPLGIPAYCPYVVNTPTTG